MSRPKGAKNCSELWQAHKCAELTPNEKIMRARRKPAGVSDVRWRMELRRRANADHYDYSMPPGAVRKFGG